MILAIIVALGVILKLIDVFSVNLLLVFYNNGL